jgi:hypothetical protein
MDPQSVPPELSDLSIIEQQLICRISPCINIHMLKHGGIASAGHCVTFPQEVNEPAKIFPRLPSEINIVRVRKLGKNDTSKDYSVRRQKIQEALLFLKNNNSAYTDIIISQDRLNSLPVDGELTSFQICISIIDQLYSNLKVQEGHSEGPCYFEMKIILRNFYQNCNVCILNWKTF